MGYLSDGLVLMRARVSLPPCLPCWPLSHPACLVHSWLMADDKGKVCATKDLDFYTGCCKEGQQHACDK